MPFKWTAGWDTVPGNNNGATQAQIITILATANNFGTGDAGLRNALTIQDDSVTIEKGIHAEGPHIRVFYSGGTWHVNLVGTKDGGLAGYRVGSVTQWAA